MSPTKKRSGGLLRCACVALAVLLSSAISRSAAAAPPDEGAGKEPPPADLYTQQGALLAESEAVAPVGHYRLVKYRVEELNLPAPMTVEVQGKQVEASKAWRVTLVGGPFLVRAMPPVIWIDGASFFAQEGRDLKSVSVVVFDRSLLKEGATLAFSYGKGESFTRLPQKLSFPAGSPESDGGLP